MKKAIYLLLIPVLGAGSCKSPVIPETPPEPVRLRVEPVVEREVNIPATTSGRLGSKAELKLSFKTGGIIREISIQEGRSVKKGQEMARLDLSEIGAEVNKARLGVEKARRDFQRVENLFRDTVATLEQYQNAKTALDLARSNLQIALFNKEYSVIKAPADGKVLKKLAETSEMAGPGYPVFLFASTEAEWVVRVSLTDRDIVRVGFGDSASIFFDAFPGRIFSGHVSEIGTMADPYTGTYEVELQLDEPPLSLVSGLVAKAEVFHGEGEKIIVVPVSALMEGDGMEGWVYVISRGRPVKKKVGIQAVTDLGIIVRSGLQAGDSLVVEGGDFLLDHSSIVVL